MTGASEDAAMSMTRATMLVGALVGGVALLVAGNILALGAMTAWGLDAGSLLAFINAIGVMGLTSTLVGVLICWRVRGNPIGVLLIVGSLMLMSVFVAWPLVVVRDAAGATTLLDGVVAWWGNAALLPAIFLIAPAVGMLFPDGRLPSPRWRPWFALAVGILGVGVALQTVAPWVTGAEAQPVPNPFALDGIPTVVSEIGGAVAAVAVFAAFALSVGAIAVRFRRAVRVERAQLKWLMSALAVMAVVFPISFATDAGPADLIDLGSVLAGALIPAAIGVAILRYRLYDIDRLISRTIGWAVVTGVLVAVFAAGVLGLQAFLGELTQGDTLAVAVSTLVAFALFQPLRRRVQHAVDRRFDRSRYDAERTAAAFAGRLRDEVDLETLTAELEATATSAVRPTAASIWLPSRTTR